MLAYVHKLCINRVINDGVWSDCITMIRWRQVTPRHEFHTNNQTDTQNWDFLPYLTLMTLMNHNEKFWISVSWYCHLNKIESERFIVTSGCSVRVFEFRDAVLHVLIGSPWRDLVGLYTNGLNFCPCCESISFSILFQNAIHKFWFIFCIRHFW